MKKRTRRRLGLVTAVAFAAIVIGYGSLSAYLAHQSRRAADLLHDLESVRLGDSEVSVLVLSQRHTSARQVPNSPANVNEEYQEPDFEYLFEVDPWRINVPADHVSILDSAIRVATATIGPRLRRTIGLRRWNVAGRIGFKRGRVIAVTTSALVEGRDEWLGGRWRLLETIPVQEINRFVIQTGVSWPEMNRYLVGWTHPNFSKADGAGEAVEFWVTPAATHEEKHSATQFMLKCFASRAGCRTVCDFVPGALDYARSGATAERKEVCSGTRPYRYQ
jgi:hypothetical protein